MLAASLPRRARRLPRRELVVEGSLTVLFVAAFIALAASGSSSLWAAPVTLAMVGAYAVASRVAYPIATGVAVPTQPFLVGLFAYADARLVPGLVIAALTLGTVGACLAGHSRWDRLSFGGGDAMHALGPAVVLVAAGYTRAGEAPWAILAAAFAAQCGVELASSMARDWINSGVRPRVQILVVLQVWALDAALTPIGIMAVATGTLLGADWVPLTLLPLVALVAHSARDRTERIEQLGVRLKAVQQERQRLQVAVKRIGDAFASKLDLDSLVSILAGAAVEALDAEAGRGKLVDSRSTRLSFAINDDSLLLGPLLAEAEGGALEHPAIVEAHDQAGWALAAPINTAAGIAAVVSVARSSAPFSEAERDLIDYLCQQAAISAGDIAYHEKLHRQALTDELTGVANHRRLQEVLEDAFRAHRKAGTRVSLLLLDLDDFKLVNDAFGHQTGDRLLRAVGRCLRSICRSNDEPARYGGEEFAMVLPDTDLVQATRIAERLLAEVNSLGFQAPSGEPVETTASIGVATAGAAAPDKAALIAAADAALYEAKEAGKNRVRTSLAWSPARSAPQRLAPDLPAQLQRALDDEELVVHYQPKIALPSHEPVGVEALLRWHHPELGLLGPTRFLPCAEGTDLLPQITLWVLARAVGQNAAWRDAGLHLPVAVNISTQDLSDPTFPLAVTRILGEAGVAPGELKLEVSEHMAAGEGVEDMLSDLRRCGIEIAIDDFGRGHSSLTRLRDLRVDELKLDRDLLRANPGQSDLAITRAAIALGRDLHLNVVAEGVEDADRLQLFTSMGAHAAQGFHICPPLLPHELARWVSESSTLEGSPEIPELRL